EVLKRMTAENRGRGLEEGFRGAVRAGDAAASVDQDDGMRKHVQERARQVPPPGPNRRRHRIEAHAALLPPATAPAKQAARSERTWRGVSPVRIARRRDAGISTPTPERSMYQARCLRATRRPAAVP